jgi:uncharacterized protein YdhG (YjbR/CyaY superfamily)
VGNLSLYKKVSLIHNNKAMVKVSTTKSKSIKLRPTTVNEYINAAPKDTRAKLREMRSIIRSTAKGATESLKWGMPAYSYKRILVCFAVFKNHIGFFPTPSAIKAFEKDIANYKTSKGGIQFPLEKKLPVSLIRKITGFRVMESETADEKWRQ